MNKYLVGSVVVVFTATIVFLSTGIDSHQPTDGLLKLESPDDLSAIEDKYSAQRPDIETLNLAREDLKSSELTELAETKRLEGNVLLESLADKYGYEDNLAQYDEKHLNLIRDLDARISTLKQNNN